MDKKLKRHVAGEPTRRSDRKRSKSGPPNRYEVEREEPRASSSARKLSSGQLDSITVNPSVGYRLINFIAVFTAISAHVKCKVCVSDVDAEHEAEKNTHEGRLRTKHAKNDESLDAEELFYGPEIAD